MPEFEYKLDSKHLVSLSWSQRKAIRMRCGLHPYSRCHDDWEIRDALSMEWGDNLDNYFDRIFQIMGHGLLEVVNVHYTIEDGDDFHKLDTQTINVLREQGVNYIEELVFKKKHNTLKRLKRIGSQRLERIEKLITWYQLEQASDEIEKNIFLNNVLRRALQDMRACSKVINKRRTKEREIEYKRRGVSND